MKNIETEYKWAAADKGDFKKMQAALSALGCSYEVSAPRLLDTYFDTADGDLSAEKTALRLRRTLLNGKTRYELTLKTASAIVDGLAQRRENTIPLNALKRPAALALFFKEAQNLIPKAKGLKRLFSIEDKRLVMLISAPDFSAELSFDDCLIKAVGRSKKMLEAELEFKDGDLEKFKEFALLLGQKSGLKAQVKSKVATARALLCGS